MIQFYSKTIKVGKTIIEFYFFDAAKIFFYAQRHREHSFAEKLFFLIIIKNKPSPRPLASIRIDK